MRIAIPVEYAMRYGSPSIPNQLKALRQQGCDRILLVPLYPQYSASATATAFDATFGALRDMRDQPELRTVRDFHDDAGYVAALAENVRDYWSKRGRPDVLVMSFHGIPQRAVDRGDPYEAQCQRTAALLAIELKLAPEAYVVTFQSRFGRAKWLQPYTAETLTALGRRCTERVDVICPGFVSDCLETLEEIAIESKAIFIGAGGGEFRYIPALNERHAWMDALTALTIRNLAGWVTAEAAPVSAGTRSASVG